MPRGDTRVRFIPVLSSLHSKCDIPGYTEDVAEILADHERRIGELEDSQLTAYARTSSKYPNLDKFIHTVADEVLERGLATSVIVNRSWARACIWGLVYDAVEYAVAKLYSKEAFEKLPGTEKCTSPVK